VLLSLRYQQIILALIQNPANGGSPSRLLVSDKPLLITILSWASYNALLIYRGSLIALWEWLR
jgi:hypothetical protein